MISTKISSNEAGQRFDKYLKKLLKAAPDSFIYKMLRKKNIVLNGKKADGKEILCPDDEVRLFLADETFEKFSGKSESNTDITPYEQAYRELDYLNIIYEDDNILVVNKPAGILSQKSKPGDISVNEWLTGYLILKKSVTSETLSTFRPSICNRLDRNTSGMVVCGKTLAGSQYLSSIIKDKSLEKYYYCLVSGTFRINERVTGYLYKDTSQNKVTVFSKDTDVPDSLKKDAEYIDTAFRTVNVFHTNPSFLSNPANLDVSTNLPIEKSLIFQSITLLEVQLFTGKTHQIRAHLSALGHPVIGDVKYGNTAVNQVYAKKGVCSQMLHAHKLIFPSTDHQTFGHTSGMILECPVPDIFNRLLEG